MFYDSVNHSQVFNSIGSRKCDADQCQKATDDKMKINLKIVLPSTVNYFITIIRVKVAYRVFLYLGKKNNLKN